MKTLQVRYDDLERACWLTIGVVKRVLGERWEGIEDFVGRERLSFVSLEDLDSTQRKDREPETR